jgi:hypothetical protein
LSGGAPPVGVIIPAREGGRTLGRVLEALACQDLERAMEVVVVVNGCRDNTAEVARMRAPQLERAGHRCRVTASQPGRGHSIRAAERIMGPGMRVFVDCDAVLSPNAIRELTDLMEEDRGIHFAVPHLVVASSPSVVTRAFYATWQSLPYVRESPVTFGVYAVSAEGRARWGELPLIHSDDKFARLHFQPCERAVAAGATYEVPPPRGLRALVAARKRYLAGNRELEERFPELAASDLPRHRGIVTTLLAKPSLWPSTAVFAAVYAAAAVPGKWPQ